MSGQKHSIKELKRPDKFQIEMIHVADWLAKNRKPILLYGVMPVSILVAAVVSVQKVQEHRRQSRLEALSVIDVEFDKESEVADKKRSEIQEKLMKISEKEQPSPAEGAKSDGATPGQAAPATEAAAPSDPKALAEERKKLEAEMKAIKADHSKTLADYQTYFGKNMSNAEGWRSGLRVVNILVEEKKFQEAATIADQVLKAADSLDFYKIQVRFLYVSILEELERYDDALQQVALLEKAADEGTQPKVLLTKGRIELLKNQKDVASKTFEGLIAKHGTTAEAQKAKTIMALWN